MIVLFNIRLGDPVRLRPRVVILTCEQVDTGGGLPFHSHIGFSTSIKIDFSSQQHQIIDHSPEEVHAGNPSEYTVRGASTVYYSALEKLELSGRESCPYHVIM